ncbi:11692_t:CDS:1, partial [Gigaspora rosea]
LFADVEEISGNASSSFEVGSELLLFALKYAASSPRTACSLAKKFAVGSESRSVFEDVE